jgi:hypothetical protein
MFALITNLLDPDEAPALELARNYSQRWHIELLFRLVKVDLRTPGGILRSRSPQGVRQEIWALLCLYQALRTLITQAALIAQLDATRISFPPALDGSQRLRRPGFFPLITWPPPSDSSSPTYPAGSSVTAHIAPPEEFLDDDEFDGRRPVDAPRVLLTGYRRLIGTPADVAMV